LGPLNDWEARCNRCGLCCFEKFIEPGGGIRVTSVACRFLDIVTRECKVYEKRLLVGEGCVKLTPEVVASIDWLPAECAYRKDPTQPVNLRSKKPRRKCQ